MRGCNAVVGSPSERDPLVVELSIDHGSMFDRGEGTAAASASKTIAEAAASSSPVDSSSSNSKNIPTCSRWQTIANTISVLAGAGLLNIPLALQESKWFGIAMVILMAGLCTYTSRILIHCLDAVRWANGGAVTYGDVAFEATGSTVGRYVVTIQVYLSLFSSACAYLMITSNYISIMFDLPYQTVAIVLGIVIWSHIFLQNLSQIARFSIWNVAMAFWVEAVIIADAMYPSESYDSMPSFIIGGAPSSSADALLSNSSISNNQFNNSSSNSHHYPEFFALDYPDDLASASPPLQVAYSLVLVISAFFCHPAIPSFYNAMTRPRDCAKAVTWSLQGALVLLYLPICLVTYAVYGTSLQVPVFMNLRNSSVRDIAILISSVHLMLSYIVMIFPLETAVERQVVQFVERRWQERNALILSRLRNRDSTWAYKHRQVIIRSTIVLVSVLVVLCVEPASHVFFMVLTIPVASLGLVCPSWFYLKLCPHEITSASKVLNVAIIVLGSWALVFGFYATYHGYMTLGYASGTPPA